MYVTITVKICKVQIDAISDICVACKCSKVIKIVIIEKESLK